MSTLVDLAKHKNWKELADQLATVTKLPKNTRNELFVRSVVTGDSKLLSRLLDLGADVNGRWKSYTPLGTAADLIDLKLVRFLLEHGSNVNSPSFEGAPPLVCVARFGMEWDDASLRRKAVKTAKLLLDAEADIDLSDQLGRTALDYAYASAWPELAKLLIASGASLTKCEDRGQQLLFHAVTTALDARLLKLYLQNGGDPSIPIGFDTTALEYASSTNRLWALKILTKAGGPPQSQKQARSKSRRSS